MLYGSVNVADADCYDDLCSAIPAGRYCDDDGSAGLHVIRIVLLTMHDVRATGGDLSTDISGDNRGVSSPRGRLSGDDVSSIVQLVAFGAVHNLSRGVAGRDTRCDIFAVHQLRQSLRNVYVSLYDMHILCERRLWRYGIFRAGRNFLHSANVGVFVVRRFGGKQSADDLQFEFSDCDIIADRDIIDIIDIIADCDIIAVGTIANTSAGG